MDLIQFFGRFHVLVLHLPIGILEMAACLEIYAFLKKRARSEVMQTVWLWGAISAIGTCILGYMLSLGGGYNADAVAIHMTYGISVAVFSIICWLLFGKNGTKATTSVAAFSVVQLILLTLTGHYGANMTHGSTFLVEHAPQAIRTMAGLPAATKARLKPASLDVALVYPDIIQPIFESRCVGCHNDEKTKGELKLNNHAAILKGGKTGPAVMANSLENSELFKRINLHPSDENFMPAEGKTALTENQIAILKWWIENGAVENASLKDVGISADLQTIIASELGLSNIEVKFLAADADPNIIEKLEDAGFKFRRSIQDEPYIEVIYSTPLVPLTDDTLNLLLAIKDQLTVLKLSRSSLNDTQMAVIGQLTELYSLNISDTQVTNEGAKQLLNLSNLKSLNLFSTGVNNFTQTAEENLPELEHIYGGE